MPDVPTLTRIADVQQTSVTLTWDFGNTTVMNSSVVYYVDVSSTSLWQSTTTIDSLITNTSVVHVQNDSTLTWRTSTTIDSLTGLTPGHMHVFYLEVRSFDKTARSQNYTVVKGELVVSLQLFCRRQDSNKRFVRTTQIRYPEASQ